MEKRRYIAFTSLYFKGFPKTGANVERFVRIKKHVFCFFLRRVVKYELRNNQLYIVTLTGPVYYFTQNALLPNNYLRQRFVVRILVRVDGCRVTVDGGRWTMRSEISNLPTLTFNPRVMAEQAFLLELMMNSQANSKANQI